MTTFVLLNYIYFAHTALPSSMHVGSNMGLACHNIIMMLTSLLALPVVTLCYTVDQRLIYVDSSQTDVNDSSCWEGGYSTPCLSLNLTLKGAQHYNHSTTILLQPGQHQLHSGSETQLRNMSQLAIVGNGSEGEPVVITCQPLAGLAFLWSTNITISNLRLIGCGIAHLQFVRFFVYVETSWKHPLSFLCRTTIVEGNIHTS